MREEKSRRNSRTADHSLLIMDSRGFDFSNLFGLLRANCAFMVLEFIMADLVVLLSVSKRWNQHIRMLLSGRCGRLASAFTNRYRDSFSLHSYRVCVSKAASVEAWYRVEFVFQASICQALEGKSVVVTLSHKQHDKKKRQMFTNWCFDCLDSTELRNVWALRDEKKNSIIPQVTTVMPLLQVKSNDKFEIVVCFWSGDGLIDVHNTEWLDIVTHRRPVLFTSRNKLLDWKLDSVRSSKIEFVAKWLAGDTRAGVEKTVPSNYLAPYFERVELHSAGLDPVYIKAVFRAVRKGRQLLIRSHPVNRSRSRRQACQTCTQAVGQKWATCTNDTSSRLLARRFEHQLTPRSGRLYNTVLPNSLDNGPTCRLLQEEET